MAEQSELVSDPGLIAQLEQAWENQRRFTGAATPGPPATAQTPVGRDSRGNPTTATPDSAKAALLSGQDPRGMYPEGNNPNSPGRQLLGGGMNALGMGVQMGSALLHPAGRIPAVAGALNKMAAGGRVAAIAAKVAPAVAEGSTAAIGSAMQGGTEMDLAMSALMPTGMRAGYNNIVRGSVKATIGALAPDQTKVAIMGNIDKKYGPGFISSELWERTIRPHNQSYLDTPQLSTALNTFQMPLGQTTAEQLMASRLQQVTQKYNIGMGGRNATLGRIGMPGSANFGNIPTSVQLGQAYDDMKQLDEIASYAREQGFKNYATKINGIGDHDNSLKKAILADMEHAFPDLKDARVAMYKESSVKRLYEVMRSNEPAVEWNSVKNDSTFRKAFTDAERDDIHNTMDILSSMGGGQQWLGRILGHGGAAVIGAVAGVGAAVGGSNIWATLLGGAAGGAGGAMLPYLVGEAMAKPIGRSILRGLMKRNPVGLDAAGLNMLAQWLISDRTKGQPSGIVEQPKVKPAGRIMQAY